MEDVKKTEKTDGTEGNDVKIVVDSVNADTSETGKSTVTIGEGADVDLTVKDSNLTTGGHGIDIGVNLEGKDENKGANVDLTLDNTNINLTEKDNTAGIVARDHSKVEVTLKGENTIDARKPWRMPPRKQKPRKRGQEQPQPQCGRHPRGRRKRR